MSLVLKLISSPWFWVDVVVSITGVFLVFWGLWLEKKADQKLPPSDFQPDIFGDIVERQKAQLERGWRILMIGIVVEGVAALGISVISGLEIAQLNDQASKSNLRVAQLETDVVQLRTIGERAKESAALATTEAEKVKKEREIAEAGRLALEIKLRELEEKQGDRIIKPKQDANLVQCLRKWTGQKFVMLRWQGVVNAKESEAYGVQIFSALERAGFMRIDERAFNFIGMSSPGVHLLVKQPENPPPLALHLKRCFIENGISPVELGSFGDSITGNKTNLVIIFIGNKP